MWTFRVGVCLLSPHISRYYDRTSILQQEFNGRLASSFNPGWSFDEPFAVTGVKFIADLEGDEGLRSFQTSFQAAFEVSTFKHTQGRAQKKFGSDLASSVASIIGNIKSTVSDDFCIVATDEAGVDDKEHADLLAACQPSVFCMTGGSVSALGFESPSVFQL
jgi:hypothetical protein